MNRPAFRVGKKDADTFRSAFWVVGALLVALRLWLVAGIPKLIRYAPHDDLFYAKAAHHLLHGEWMGPYSEMTLIKGPFYAFFLVASYFSTLPVLVSESLFYLGACLVFFRAVAPLVPSRWLRLIAFAVLLFCPAGILTTWSIRVYREFVYLSLNLYVAAFATGLLLRLRHGLKSLLGWSVGMGAAMAGFLLSREDGLWIMPMIALLLVGCVVFVWWRVKTDRVWRTLLVCLPIVVWNVPIQMVSYANYEHYGTWIVADYLEPNFLRALDDLGRIQTAAPWHPAIQVSGEARRMAYEASPTLGSLAPLIEDGVVGWNVNDDGAMSGKPQWYLNQYGSGGSEVGNAHFPWLLRQAVAKAGYYRTGASAAGFYKAVGDELEAACRNGMLDCAPSAGVPLVGSIDPRHLPIIGRMAAENAVAFAGLQEVQVPALDIEAWPAWMPGERSYKYFVEITYDAIDVRRPMGLVDDETDARLKILGYKQRLIEAIG
ncbi:MAG TPA: hypothetical protein VLY63_32835, partial [Anaerolineae bacterium]|nr:hypothetical protein [Anaerolineae bacterium]